MRSIGMDAAGDQTLTVVWLRRSVALGVSPNMWR